MGRYARFTPKCCCGGVSTTNGCGVCTQTSTQLEALVQWSSGSWDPPGSAVLEFQALNANCFWQGNATGGSAPASLHIEASIVFTSSDTVMSVDWTQTCPDLSVTHATGTAILVAGSTAVVDCTTFIGITVPLTIDFDNCETPPANITVTMTTNS